jgi:hypothetical protein
VVGARGTGKSELADRLGERWAHSGIDVLRFDGGALGQPEVLIRPLADLLSCQPDALTADALPDGRLIRVMVDRAEQLFERPWLPAVQEQLRALLSTPAARGRVGLIVFGRPTFREFVGGRGSPLLNLGVTINTSPVTVDELVSHRSAPENVARAIIRKTGGHPALTDKLLVAIHGDAGNFGAVMPGFVRDHETYLLRLAEDHGLRSMELLGRLLEVSGGRSEQELLSAVYGQAVSSGLDAVNDLIGCGLVARDDRRRCTIGASLLAETASLRPYLRVPEVRIPVDEPLEHLQASRLLYQIENAMRRLVVGRLAAADDLWWSNRVPAQLLTDAEGRRASEAESGASAEAFHPIMFLSLGELFDVLLENRNWEEVFGLAVGLSRESVQAHQRTIIAVRNKVAHSRPVPGDDVAAMRLSAGKLGLVS